VTKLEAQKLREVCVIESRPLADAEPVPLICHNRPQSNGNLV
jgi:hypothetical protein